MGAHSIARSPRADAGRLAGTGVLAAVALAGGAGVASAHGTGSDDHGDGSDRYDGHRSSWVVADDARSVASDPGGVCAVLGDVDLPGLDCTDSGSTTSRTDADADADTGRSTSTPSTPSSRSSEASSASASMTPTSSSAPATGTGTTTRNAADVPQDPRPAPSEPAVVPKSSGNPIDAPGEPGTTRTLPIGG